MNHIMSLDSEPQTIETYPGAQAVSRAIALLKAFDDAHAEWSLAEISDYVNLNRATTHRLLAALESEGLIQRNTTGHYRLGHELIGLGGCAMRASELREAARPELETLARETGETAVLEVLAKRHTLIIDEVSDRDPLGISQDIGARLPIHATSTGKLLLAHRPPAEIDEHLQGALAAVTPRTITDPAALRAQLDEIVARGYAVADGELDVGFIAVAAPVYDAGRAVVAAVSVGGPALRIPPERRPEIVASLQVTARRISRRLGYRPG